MSEPPIGRYRDADGTSHHLVVRQTPDGDWRVLDLDLEAETAHVVDTLAGEQDGRPQAEAVARDYLSSVGAHEPGAGTAAGESIPEQGGADAERHRRQRPRVREQHARGVALPRAAR